VCDSTRCIFHTPFGDELVSVLTTEFEKQLNKVEASSGAALPSQNGALTDLNERQAALKKIIKDLHAGEDIQVLKGRFRELIQNVKKGKNFT